MHHETARHVIRLLPLLLAAALSVTAREAWHFLPTFNHDIRGIEARPAKEKPFSETVPAPAQKLLKPDSGLTEKQRGEVHWHTAMFPHRDFVNLMPENRVFGWYGCQFDVPEALARMDVLVDLGIIDDSDETFVNGRLVGKTGKVPDGSAWQTDRLYRVPASLLESERNYLSVHVWSLWGLGGIVGPPVLKAALAPADAQWDVAFVKDSAKHFSGLNAAATVKEFLYTIDGGKPLEWQKRAMPWKGYADLPDDVHYIIFKLQFELKNSNGSPKSFSKPVVLDAGAVFDVASFHLNGRRLGLVGRFPEGGEPAFTEATQRAQFIVPPDAWSADGHNELVAVVYRERGVGGLPGVPGILLSSPSDNKPQRFDDVSKAFLIQLQSGNLAQAEAVLSHASPKMDTERVWLLSHQTHLAFLKWLDGGRKNAGLLDGVLAPVAEILVKHPADSPKQSAMQAFCRILRLAEKDEKLLAQVRRHFPKFGGVCRALPPDRRTLGDWPMLYGNRRFILAAYGKISDASDSADGKFAYHVSTGDPLDTARRWQPQNARLVSSANALVMPWNQFPNEWNDSLFAEEYAKTGTLFPDIAIRRAAWWDDHGEMHPFDDSGPDLHVSLKPGMESSHILSLYLLDYDWRKSLHPRQQSVMITDKAGQLLNACWSGKSDLGAYERFVFSAPCTPTFRVIKHRGACVALAGVFIDSPPMTKPETASSLQWNSAFRRPSAEAGSKNTFSPEVYAAIDIVLNAERNHSCHLALPSFRTALGGIGKTEELVELIVELSKLKDIHPAWQVMALGHLKPRLAELTELERKHVFRRLMLACNQKGNVPVLGLVYDIEHHYKAKEKEK